MAAYRFYNPAPVFESLLGTENLPNGSLTFYDRGTTTPRNTYSDPELTTPNTNPVILDGGGRANTNIWLDGEYTVVLEDSLGAVVWTRDVAPEVGQELTIPALAPGFLTNDGVNLLWQTVREMPDPTGSTNQVPVTDGAGYVLTNMPTDPVIPDPETEVGADFYRSGVSTDPTKFLVQWGSASASVSGSKSTTSNIVFATPYATPPKVFVINTTGYVTQKGNVQPTVSATSVSTTGATFLFSTQTGEDNSDNNIVTPVGYDWVAFGTVEITPP